MTPGSDAREESVDVLLACMPFGSLNSPSLGLSLLAARLRQAGLQTRVCYFSIDFATEIGLEPYVRISNGEPNAWRLLGEWVFARAALGSAEDDAYLDRNLPAGHDLVAPIRRAREVADGFLDRAAETIAAHEPGFVGFTSVFQQTQASLGAAKRVRELLPETLIAMGGANCEAPMGAELVRRFPFLDVAVSGEADDVILPLVGEALDGRRDFDLPGVYTRHRPASEVAASSRPRDLDSLPVPDYGDFFAQYDAAGLTEVLEPRLLFETSRGCWWGEKSHCTFCGLNGSSLVFRSKSAERALTELETLAEEYGNHGVSVVDNILDYRYFRDFLPALAEKGLDLDLFYEVKANLTREQLVLLSAAGIRDLQPGIESLSTPVLRLMGKGVSRLQNIQLLKWCQELDVTVSWNMLWGFPGEDPAEYEEMARLVPFLEHLQPPCFASKIRLDRFSPNFERAGSLGFDNVRPFPGYFEIFSGLPDEAVANLAYFFTYTYASGQDVRAYTRGLSQALDEWRGRHERSALFRVRKEQGSFVCDLRSVAADPFVALSPLEARVLDACSAMAGRRRIEEEASGWSGDEVGRALQRLVERGFVVGDRSSFLSVVTEMDRLRLGEPALELLSQMKGGHSTTRLGEPRAA